MNIFKKAAAVALSLMIISGNTVFAAKNKGYKFPVPNHVRISQYYSGSHSAIDIAANTGSEVYATKSGTIIKKYTGCNNFSRGNGKCSGGGVCNPNHGYSKASGSAGYCNDGFGNGYIIKHDDGTWAEYAHMNYLSDSLYEGGYVTQGTYLGGVSSTGVSTGPHLHFGLRTGNVSSFWRATPLNPLDYMDADDGGSGNAPVSNNSSVSVTTTEAKNISETNATVYGAVSYSGSKPSEVGIYFGTSSDSMNKVARDSIGHNKNPFDMWYDLNGKAGQYLSSGTTYYCQCYAIVDGKETKGEIKSFNSTGPVSTPVPISTPEPKTIATPTSTPVYIPDVPVSNDNSPSVLTVFGGNTLQIAVDNKIIGFPDAQPFIDSNNRTQVPIRAISEILNCRVDWSQMTQTAIITKENGNSVTVTIGSDIMTIGNQKIVMDTAAMVIDGRTYIPVRYVAEALGLKVEWK